MYNSELWFGGSRECDSNYGLKFFTKHSFTMHNFHNKKSIDYAKGILSDEDHLLSHCFKILPRSGKYQSLKCRTSRFSNSFIPTIIPALNA